MSVERLVRGALLQAFAGRLACESVALTANVFVQVGKGLERVADSFFYLEAEGARRYKAATGVDLGYVVGDDSRFEATERDFQPELIAGFDDDLDVEDEDEL